ncbi:gas vesicle protein [Streptomyces sp. NBC_01276]|uniref:gas vesicle protein GvpO n=1 Tax=Streptomyces sp. NBC_01276 TaxID=2903808 RepID=UPI00352E0083
MAPAEPGRRRRPDNDESDREPPARPVRKAASRTSSSPSRGVGGAAAAMRAAAEQLAQLLGRPPESVSSLKPTEDGWEAQVEVLELERVPDTTSILASYRVAIDKTGELVSYERTRRYSRGMIDRPA